MRPSAAGWSMAGPSRTRASAALVLLCLPLVAAAGWGLGGGDDDDASIARAARRTVREAFVKNLNGTSFAEVSAITNVVPLGVATRHAIDAMRGVRTTPGGVAVDARGNPLRAMPMVCLDFVCVVLPALAAMLAPAVALPTLFAVGCAAILAATRARARRRAIHAGGDDARSDDGFNDVVATSPRRSFLARFPGPWYRPPPRSADEQSSRRPSALPLGPLDVLGAPRPYLAAYRAAMTLTTAVAILAVDFSAFPRRLAKTDSTRGVGLMDVGSGSFVLANALASRVARGLTTSSPSWWFAFWKRASVDVSSSNAHAGGGRDATNDATGAAPPERAHTIARTLRSTRWWSLIFLACARGLATHAMDYQQPVGEYGRHWNFFATLAVVDLCATATPLPPAFSSFAGLAILVAHQTSLLRGASPSGAGAAGVASSYGEYLLRDVPRGEGLLEQNKEGVGSIPGYVALYFLGAGLGRFVERSLCDAAKRASIRCVVIFLFLFPRVRTKRNERFSPARHRSVTTSRSIARVPSPFIESSTDESNDPQRDDARAERGDGGGGSRAGGDDRRVHGSRTARRDGRGGDGAREARQRVRGRRRLGRVSGAFYTLVPIRPRRRGGRRSLRTFAVVSLRPPLGFNTRPRRLSTPPDAFQLHPDFRLYGTTFSGRGGGCCRSPSPTRRFGRLR